VTPIPADGENAEGSTHQPSGQDALQGAAEDDAAEDAGASDSAGSTGSEDGTQKEAPAPKPSGADTSTVALTVVDAKTT
jgi:macrolide phosphotransferase